MPLKRRDMRWLFVTIEKHKVIYTPLIVLLTFTIGISYMGLGFVMPLQTLYSRQIGATSTEIGLMTAAPLLTGFLVVPLIGRTIDHLGHRTVLWSGLSLHACLFLAYTLVHIPTWLIVLRATEGITIVCILPPARSLMNTLAPDTRQGEALGLLSAAQMGGILIGPLFGTLFATQVGFIPSFLCAGLLLGVSALAARFFLPQQASPSLKTGRVGPWSLSKDLFTCPLILAYSLKGVLSTLQGVALAVWSIYMQDRGALLPLIGLTWALYSIPIILIAPFAGRYSDRHGRFLPIAFGLIAYSITYSLYGFYIPLAWIVVISFSEGIIAAVVITALDGFLADSMPMHKRGHIQAIFGAAGNAGSFLGAIAAGLLYTLAPGIPFLMMSVLFLSIGGIVHLPRIRQLLTDPKSAKT